MTIAIVAKLQYFGLVKYCLFC